MYPTQNVSAQNVSSHKMYPPQNVSTQITHHKMYQHKMYPATKRIQPPNVSGHKTYPFRKYILTKHLTTNPKTLKYKSAKVVITSAKFLFHIESAE